MKVLGYPAGVGVFDLHHPLISLAGFADECILDF